MSTRARLTSPDKLLWPAAEVTKADLRRYVEAAADRLLPHVARRPLTLLRCPNGVDAEGFFQKNLPDKAPDWLPRHKQWTPSSKRTVAYPMAATVEDLQYYANQNAVEFHHAPTRADRDHRPDLLAFDLDPGEQPVPVALAALWLREVLDWLGLEAAVKTSGKRGLHLYVPIERRYPFEHVRALGLAVARACADRHPSELTIAMRKVDREGRLLLDWSRNGSAQTLVAAWSPRRTAEATVSMPLTWDEVDEHLEPRAFTLATALQRPDAWAGMPPAQRLERAAGALEQAGYPLVDASPRSRVR